MKAFEIGYRVQPQRSMSVDVALFYNGYAKLITPSKPVAEFSPGGILLAQRFVNEGGTFETNGGELAVRWRPLARWEVSSGLTETRGSSQALPANPKHLLNVQSRLDLPGSVELNSGLYHYSSVPLGRASVANPLQEVPAFTRIDVGLCWHLGRQWSFAVWGQNLQSEAHRETRETTFGDQAGNMPRSAVFQLTWRSAMEGSGGRSQ
jgi:iron complex outermembrane recepter protein